MVLLFENLALMDTAPGQLNYPKDLIFLSNGTLVVGDNSYLNYFQADGTFIKRTNSSSARSYVAVWFR